MKAKYNLYHFKPLYLKTRNNIMGFGKLFCTFFCIFILSSASLVAQEDKIPLDSLDLKNTRLLFQEYEIVGQFCKDKKGFPRHCDLQSKLLDNNIEELTLQHSDALTFLDIEYEIVLKEEVNKKIYDDKSFYRYVFEYTPTVGKKLNSCMSNPGSLLLRFSVYDRLEDKRYDLDLKYMMFICDIQILVNDINKSLKEKKK